MGGHTVRYLNIKHGGAYTKGFDLKSFKGLIQFNAYIICVPEMLMKVSCQAFTSGKYNLKESCRTLLRIQHTCMKLQIFA
jgi:hypothetical protein